MSFEKRFEKQNFNKNETNVSEQKLLTRDFLEVQVRLPRDQWNENFRQLVEKKIRENQQIQSGIEKSIRDESPEFLRERTFQRYMEGLGLSEESLRGKKVLDLGCGEGEFVKYLIEKGITSEAYGIDINLDENAIEDKFKKHLRRGNFEEDLPVQNVDYIVSVGAVSNGVWAGEEVMDIRKIVEKSLASLKNDGEIRIYPLQESAEATPLAGLQASQKKWEELLKEISETQNVECKIEPRNIKVSGKENSIILESVLIIRRKRN